MSPGQAAALIGADLGASRWLLIDQAMVDAFAAVTGDRQFIHTDPERARDTPFNGTIAHGFLTLSLTASLLPDRLVVLDGLKMGLNYGFDTVRFLAPVRTGSRIRARHRLLEIEDKGGGRWLIKTEVTVEIEGQEKPALVAQWLGLQFT